MKKLILLLSVLTVILSVPVLNISAKHTEAIIPVEVSGGGTVIIVPENGSPEPETTLLKLKDGETGKFKISTDIPGDYIYTLFVKNEGKKGVLYDKTVYDATISINVNEDGEIYSVTVIKNKDNGDKSESATFINYDAPPITGTEPESTSVPTAPTAPTGPQESTPQKETTTGTTVTYHTEPTSPDTPHSSTRGSTYPSLTTPDQTVPTHTSPDGKISIDDTPETGDNTNIEFYLLLAILASAGLFALSIIYTISTNKLINGEL